MPVNSSHGNFSVKGYGGAVGEPFLVLSTNPSPASQKNYYTESGIAYMAVRITASCTLLVDGPGISYPVQTFIVGGGTSRGATSGGAQAGGPGGAYRVTGINVSGGSPQPIVIGGADTASSLGPVVSTPGGTAGGAGGAARPAPPAPATGVPGSPGVQNSYWLGTQQWYSGGGGGGNIQNGAGSGGAGGGGAGGNTIIPSPSGAGGQPGQANTGGGAGGPGGGMPTGFKQPIIAAPGSTGGSGVIIIRGPASRFR